jgi:hypothetical protein
MAAFGKDFLDFLIEAKRKTYASGNPPTSSCRKASKDLGYTNGAYGYLDSYLGTSDFIGEEIVYKDSVPIWGMNYFGLSIADADGGDTGMGEMLHAALMEPPIEAPYRGPRSMKKGDCEYRCSWYGELGAFGGEEEILRKGVRIYFLRFHGGVIS